MTVQEAVSLWCPAGAAKPSGTIRLQVADWMGCGPGRAEKEDWFGWARGEPPRSSGTPPDGPFLPAALRRRITPIGRMAFRAAYGLAEGVPARFIFCSRHGELRRTQALLEALARREELSPAEFSLSVHNALAGLLSIVGKNEAGHTAIAAGTDSFGFGLLEAAACLAARPTEPILLVYFDESLPEEYAALREGEEPGVALALLLVAPQGGPDDIVLSFAPKPRDEPAWLSTEQALDFMRFLLSGESERQSPGGSIQWRWHRDAA
jgi:hypothetical protein